MRFEEAYEQDADIRQKLADMGFHQSEVAYGVAKPAGTAFFITDSRADLVIRLEAGERKHGVLGDPKVILMARASGTPADILRMTATSFLDAASPFAAFLGTATSVPADAAVARPA